MFVSQRKAAGRLREAMREAYQLAYRTSTTLDGRRLPQVRELFDFSFLLQYLGRSRVTETVLGHRI